MLVAMAPSALAAATLLLTNGVSYTGNDAQPHVEAVLAIDGRIAFVGAAAAARQRAPVEAEILKTQCVMTVIGGEVVWESRG